MEDKKYSRRYFIKTISAGSAALSVLGCNALTQKKHLPKIGLQLYTLRSIIFDDFPGIIKKIAEMGYAGVETWGGLSDQIDLKVIAKTFKDNELQVFGCHCDLPIDDKRDIALQMADVYKSDRLIYPGGSREELFSNDEQIKKTIETYNDVTNDLKAQGVKFGLHNHSWEFEQTEQGVIPFFYFLENLNKDIFFEIDTYWTQTGGYDPAEAIKKAGKRAPLLHIKDGIAQKGENEGIHVPLGTGNMDIPAIAKAGAESIEWMVVEFDNYEIDILDGLKKSYDYLIKNKLAKGNI